MNSTIWTMGFYVWSDQCIVYDVSCFFPVGKPWGGEGIQSFLETQAKVELDIVERRPK